MTEYFSALYIVKTSLNALHLHSLNLIRAGSVAILENKALCFADSVNWTKIMRSQQHAIFLQNNSLQEQCKELGLTCSVECSGDGCWGLGPQQCLACAHFQLDDTCVESCDPKLGYVAPAVYSILSRTNLHKSSQNLSTHSETVQTLPRRVPRDLYRPRPWKLHGL